MMSAEDEVKFKQMLNQLMDGVQRKTVKVLLDLNCVPPKEVCDQIDKALAQAVRDTILACHSGRIPFEFMMEELDKAAKEAVRPFVTFPVGEDGEEATLN